MSLNTLAAQLTREAAGGTVALSAATLTPNGLAPASDFDQRLAAAFQLAAAPLVVTTSPSQIGTPTATELTMTGTITAWRLAATPVTVTVTVSGATATVTLVADLGVWSFATSFPRMAGFPFDNLELTNQTFVFASSPVGEFAWRGHQISLLAGLNFAGQIDLPPWLAALQALLPASTPGNGLVISGSIDPSVIDGGAVGSPNVDLRAPLWIGPLPAIGCLQLTDAAVGLEVVTEGTVAKPAQYRDAFLATRLDFGPGEPKLDCRVSITAGSSLLTLLLYPDAASPAPGLDALIAVLAGQSWDSALPAPLRSLFTSFGFAGLEATIDTSGTVPELLSVAVCLRSGEPWTVLAPWTVQDVELGWRVDLTEEGPQSWAQLGGLVRGLSIFPDGIYLSIDTDLRVTSSYRRPVPLASLVQQVSGGTVPVPARFGVDLTGLDLLIDPGAETYSISASAEANLDLLDTGALLLHDVEVNLVHTSGGTDAAISGCVVLDSVAVQLEARYTAGVWHFEGGLTEDSHISLGALLTGAVPSGSLPDFLPSDLVLAPLWLTADVTETTSQYTARAGLTWMLPQAGALSGVQIAAEVDLHYDSAAAPAFSGGVRGDLTLPGIGLDVLAEYRFGTGDQLAIDWRGVARAQYSFADDTVIFEVARANLGDLLGELLGSDPAGQLPEPWDRFDDLTLDGIRVACRLGSAATEPGSVMIYGRVSA